MARRKKSQEQHENHERWLVSYADFITLLFAFFVMMYSISSVNEGKYRVLADSMVSAFQSVNEEASPQAQPVVSKTPIQVGQTPKMLAPIPDKVSAQDAVKKTPDSKIKTQKKAPEKLKQDLSTALSRWTQDGKIKITANTRWVDIEISSGVLYQSGSADLSNQAVALLEPLTFQLMTNTNPIYVFGYSDNIPIYTQKFSSNWELSAARAVSVVNLFTELGMDPENLAAIGYGEHRPIADNTTEEGRAKNRRVVIRVFSGDDIFSESGDDKT